MTNIYLDHHGYKVGMDGTIIGLHGRPLRPDTTAKGYHRVVLCYDGNKHTVRVHRLVADIYCINPRPDVYTQIDHIDGDPDNNHARNLAWCTCSQNIQAKYDLRRQRGVPVLTEREQIAIAHARACRKILRSLKNENSDHRKKLCV